MFFDYAIAIILEKEGGFQDYKTDPANYTKDNKGGNFAGTNYGISANLYQKLFPTKNVTMDTMRNLTLAEAKDIYKKEFWDKLRLDEVKSKYISTFLMDFCVHRSPVKVTKRLQAVLKNQFIEDVSTDGQFGTGTLAALNRCATKYEAKLYNALSNDRKAYYDSEGGSYVAAFKSRVDTLPAPETTCKSDAIVGPEPYNFKTSNLTSNFKNNFANNFTGNNGNNKSFTFQNQNGTNATVVTSSKEVCKEEDVEIKPPTTFEKAKDYVVATAKSVTEVKNIKNVGYTPFIVTGILTVLIGFGIYKIIKR